MIKNPAILWIIFALQIIFFISGLFGMITVIQMGHFSPMFLVNFAMALVLLWVTVSHIKLLSKSQPTDADPFS